MKADAPLEFKIASTEREFEQIYSLNYRTFVEEIPQHRPDPTGKLIDKYHKENTYIICKRGDRLVGMVAVRAARPFSLDEKIPNLDSYLPPARSICELRLLSVEKDHRRGHIFHGLMTKLVEYGTRQGYDLAIISGTVRQLKLYQHVGFVPFGPLVGTPDALYQPMYLTREAFEQRWGSLVALAKTSPAIRTIVNLLPGPVSIKRQVRRAFAESPISHRSEPFLEIVQETKKLLCELTHASQVEILMGSGTLANDAIAGQLSLARQHGLILSNGEFGERLIGHATRWGLSFDKLQLDWEKAFESSAIRNAIERNPRIKWVWGVHCETSTGTLNDLAFLKETCAEKNLALCMDCISSIGTMPVDLRGIYLASGVSGKGLASFPGLALVFYNHRLVPAPTELPSYLDLGLYAAKNGVPYTISSNLVQALHTALKRLDVNKVFNRNAAFSAELRSKLRAMGFQIVAADEHASPAVITIALPKEIRSESVGERAGSAGYLLSYRSEYLLKRNWIQICLMGEYSRKKAASLVQLLQGICSAARRKWSAET